MEKWVFRASKTKRARSSMMVLVLHGIGASFLEGLPYGWTCKPSAENKL
jgi:hypothetical protein